MRRDAAINEVGFKLVYYGPGLAGKTTNLEYVHARTEPERRSEMKSVATATERTLSMSIKPKTLAPIDGKAVRLDFYTVPGPVFYDASRRRVLEDVDGVVFIADSQRERYEANLESLELLESNLESHGRSLADVPIVMQYNKRDLPNASPVDELSAALNPRRRPEFEAVARTGQGVFDTLKAVSGLVYDRARGPYRSPA